MDAQMKLKLFLVVFIVLLVKRRSRIMVLRYKNHTEKLQREQLEFILLRLSQLNLPISELKHFAHFYQQQRKKNFSSAISVE
jgi:hypothetical protein